jgi:hypothetical protein
MHRLAHDHHLRALLKQHLATRAGASDLVVDELELAYAATRADVVLVNSRLEGFEIKADNDTLVRLPRQVEAYDRTFELSWVLTTKTHLAAVRALVPKHWGLLVATAHGNAVALRVVRTAKRNKNRSAEHLARLLWRDELFTKLQDLGLERGLKSKPKVALFAALASAIPLEALAKYVCECLRARKDWRIAKGRTKDGESLASAADTDVPGSEDEEELWTALLPESNGDTPATK